MGRALDGPRRTEPGLSPPRRDSVPGAGNAPAVPPRPGSEIDAARAEPEVRVPTVDPGAAPLPRPRGGMFGDIRALARPAAGARAVETPPPADRQAADEQAAAAPVAPPRPTRPRLFAPRPRADAAVHARPEPPVRVSATAPAGPSATAPDAGDPAPADRRLPPMPRAPTEPAADGRAAPTGRIRAREGDVPGPSPTRALRGAETGGAARQSAADPAPWMVQASGLGLTYPTREGPVVALAGVDLTIARGDFVSFIGPSGCGKTTLLRLIADLEQPTAGSLRVAGSSPEAARRARAYGYVFQAAGLLPWLTVEENVRLPLRLMGMARDEQRARAARTLGMVGLGEFARRYPWQLSGGMQQRASIARALGFDAALLLMDEPFGALDEIVRDRLGDELRALWAATGKTVCFVTHSIPEAVYLSTRIVVMSPRPGRIVDVIDSPLPVERPADIRESPEFLAVAARVRRGLRQGGTDG